ncbi:MAG: hypothetical protein WBP81_20205 [Solirubrobacteraceae bacterium]
MGFGITGELPKVMAFRSAYGEAAALVIRTLPALLWLMCAPRTRVALAVSLGCVAPLLNEGRILPAAESFTGRRLDPTAIL